MKKIIWLKLILGVSFLINAQTETSILNTARYRDGQFNGKYIHGVNNSGEPATDGDASYRELPSGISNGVYSWWNYATALGQPTGSHGSAIGFGFGQGGSAEIWAGWTNGKLYTRFLRDCCQGWSTWNEIWTANTDGSGSGLDADTVDGLQPVLLQSSGNVGIGITDTKGFKLGVQGKIAAEEVKVAIYNNWSDFVFDKNYNLPTLSEVEQYIKANGHLKDIPSAEDVKENGVFLGDINAKLLQKIEELTLYTIEQEKKIEELNQLKAESERLNKKVETLEALVLKLVEKQ